MSNYYDTNLQTTANSVDLMPGSDAEQHFPSEGLYIGNLSGGSVEVPALVDLRETPALCFLYNDEETRCLAGSCIERLVWRLALTVPSQLCDLLLFNGGNPGDWFNAHLRINRFLFDSRQEKVFFDSSAEVFKTYLDDIYASIVERMSTIRLAGKKDLVELNESLQNDARLKYRFIIMTDFPRHLKVDVANRLKQIIEAGKRAGIYVIMSWDMRADFEDTSASGTAFDHKQMLSMMDLLVPFSGEFRFQNSGHDEVFNRFNFTIDNHPINQVEIEQYLQHIDIDVETAKKKMAPTILKQDFKSLAAAPYEPVMSEICVTVGKDVHDKHPVTFKLNSGDYIHGFILGQSGSGKSVLLNNIITSAVLKYSPEDLMLYLMDFKGVEFNRYRGLKHTKAVLVDNSDPQMTLEVLRELKEENNRRRKLFARENNCSNIDVFNRKHHDERLPQILFVADECQVIFKEPAGNSSRAIFREITEILNTIATQGRSMGIHMLLATQQLGETDISGEILKNLTECFLLMSAPSDSEKLVPDSSDLTSRQMTGIGCYYHKRGLESQVQTFYATDEELESALESAQKKTGDLPSNGGHYFCGSSKFYLDDYLGLLDASDPDELSVLIGQNIGINAGTTTLPIKQDFYENILFWGCNKEEQTTGVVMNALISLICSSRKHDLGYRFLVIDCLPKSSGQYKELLADLEERGLCQLIERQKSGQIFQELVNDVKGGLATPTVLTVIGGEKFIEMRKGMQLVPSDRPSAEEDDILGFSMDLMSELTDSSPTEMTFPQALMFLLDDGPLKNVHILWQVDKPSSIFTGDDFDSENIDAANKFRHKIILKSDNKNLNPLRFSQDIDVESLSDDTENMRAYYYPEGEDPMLFTPFQIPDATIFDNN